jgi:hypothetical protein
MEPLSNESQKSRLRELLARLDRIATVSRGHRAGLHLDDRALFDQYITILIAWERGFGPSTRSVDQAVDQIRPRPAARS